jgi:peptidoglycan/LPS O-acetylase OafA/YrhL
MSRQRYHDIDWLRILAMMTVFLFHSARSFNDEDWHVKNNTLSYGLSVFVD